MREEGRFFFFCLVRRETDSFIFVWSVLLPGGVYCQPFLANKNVQTKIVWVLQQRWVNLIKGCTVLQPHPSF